MVVPLPPPRMTMWREFLCRIIGLTLLGLVPLAASAASDAPVMMLPPLLVREHRNTGPIWRYTSVAGIEVLSRGADRLTSAFLTSFLRRQVALEEILPPLLQLRQSVPLQIILITPAVEKTMNEELVRTMQAQAKKDTSGYITSEASALQVYLLVRTIPQLTLSDAESTGIVCTLEDQRGPVQVSAGAENFFKNLQDDGSYRGMNFTAGRIGSILGGRLPPLPSWFKSGFLSFFKDFTWTDSENIQAIPVHWISDSLIRQIKRNPTAPDGTAGQFSMSGEEIKPGSGGPGSFGVGYGPKRPEDTRLALLPMGHFFDGPLGGSTPLTSAESNLWSAQASLFFHWAYAKPDRRRDFWKFVDLSSRQGVSDPLLKQCFGLDAHRLEGELLAYLPTAVKGPLVLIDPASVKLPSFELRNATYVEAARIKGEMGRKEIAYVKDTAPLSVVQYVEQVGKVLNGPVEDSERDPAELAVLGLYDCDLGNNEDAFPLLEEAAAAHVARPTLYIELAKIRRDHALARPTGADGKLGSDQLATIFGPLRESRRFAPGQAETYLLALATWAQAAVAPSHESLSFLREGTELFPDNFDVVSGTAQLYRDNGFGPEGLQIVDHAVACLAPDSTTRDRLVQFRAQIAAR
jgi:hypothetical protein